MKVWQSRLIYFGVFGIIFVLIALCGLGVATFYKDCRVFGDEYLRLASNSPDIDNAILYLEKYQQAIEKNGFNKGNCGRFFKTIDNDMSFRYSKLVMGIGYLKELQKQSGDNKNLSNFKAISTIPEYVNTLDVGVSYYLSANNLGRLFQSGFNFIILVLLPFWWLLGLAKLFPENLLFY